jgi:hypothetical protein
MLVKAGKLSLESRLGTAAVMYQDKRFNFSIIVS